MSKTNRIISIVLIIVFFLIVSVSGIMEICERGAKVIDGKTAFENRAVTIKDGILYSLFGASGNDQVIAGKDGWLFYSETAGDFTGAGTLTDEEIEIIAAKIENVRDYCRERGAEFSFAIAPNKNTIYPGYMPDCFRRASGETNIDKLINALNTRGIDCPDLRLLFDAESDLYYKTDTHWNARGASILSDYLTGRFGMEGSFRYADTEPAASKGSGGDLYKLLFPDGSAPAIGRGAFDETVYTFAEAEGFRYIDIPMSAMDLNIETETTSGKTGCLLVYRDSFGSELIPLLSSEFGYVRYLRGNMPYDLSYVGSDGPDAVVFVIAQRNIPFLLTCDFEGI